MGFENMILSAEFHSISGIDESVFSRASGKCVYLDTSLYFRVMSVYDGKLCRRGLCHGFPKLVCSLPKSFLANTVDNTRS